MLLCEETVSLLGIRQYYKLIGSSSSSSGGGSGGETSAAAAIGFSSEVSPITDAGETVGEPAHAKVVPPADKQQQQQQLGAQEVLALKVDALLQLLATVSFHQVCQFARQDKACFWVQAGLGKPCLAAKGMSVVTCDVTDCRSACGLGG